jgi:hypothetical protein
VAVIVAVLVLSPFADGDVATRANWTAALLPHTTPELRESAVAELKDEKQVDGTAQHY